MALNEHRSTRAPAIPVGDLGANLMEVAKGLASPEFPLGLQSQTATPVGRYAPLGPRRYHRRPIRQEYIGYATSQLRG